MKAAIVSHTTASFPRPHVVYVVEVTKDDGESYRITKRYSDVRT
jgi:chitinase